MRYHAPDYQARRFKPGDAVTDRQGRTFEVVRMTKRGKVTLKSPDGTSTAHASTLTHKEV